MTKNNQNIVDADVEVLDLDELQEAVGGASVARLPFPTIDPGVFPRLPIRPITPTRPGITIRPVIPGGGVLIENDGWQGNAFSLPGTLLRG